MHAGKVADKYKVAKHLTLDIFDTGLAWQRDQASHRRRGGPRWRLRHPHPAASLDAGGVVTAYKNLSRVERDFGIIKVSDLDLRPIHHWLVDRVRGHVPPRRRVGRRRSWLERRIAGGRTVSGFAGFKDHLSSRLAAVGVSPGSATSFRGTGPDRERWRATSGANGEQAIAVRFQQAIPA